MITVEVVTMALETVVVMVQTRRLQQVTMIGWCGNGCTVRLKIFGGKGTCGTRQPQNSQAGSGWKTERKTAGRNTSKPAGSQRGDDGDEDITDKVNGGS
jgi:hypothetical protein